MIETLVTDKEFQALGLKNPIILSDDSILYFGNDELFIVHESLYLEVRKKYYDIIRIRLNNDLCDLCISKGTPLRTKNNYCSLDGINGLGGKYRRVVDHDDYNFRCDV